MDADDMYRALSATASNEQQTYWQRFNIQSAIHVALLAGYSVQASAAQPHTRLLWMIAFFGAVISVFWYRMTLEDGEWIGFWQGRLCEVEREWGDGPYLQAKARGIAKRGGQGRDDQQQPRRWWQIWRLRLSSIRDCATFTTLAFFVLWLLLCCRPVLSPVFDATVGSASRISTIASEESPRGSGMNVTSVKTFTAGIAWVWTNGAVLGALVAALFTAVYVLLTYRMFRLQQTPIVTAQDAPRGGGVIDDHHSLTSLRNCGVGTALNVCIHQVGQLDALEFSWLGSLGPGEARVLNRPVTIRAVEDHPHVIWYQDANRRWYATRLATQGYGLASAWEGRKWWFTVPPTVRRTARAETVVQFYKRLMWQNGLWRWFKRGRN